MFPREPFMSCPLRFSPGWEWLRRIIAKVSARVSWRKLSATNPRPMYFSQIRIDPTTDSRIYVLGADHHGYVQRMKAAFANFGGDPERLELVIMQFVNLIERGESLPMPGRSAGHGERSHVRAGHQGILEGWARSGQGRNRTGDGGRMGQGPTG